MAKSYNWKDVSLFPDVVLKTAEEAFSQALFNLCSITKGDVLGFPELGCNPEELLFEPMDEVTEFLILDYLMNCIEGWDPRVRVSAKSTIKGDRDRNRYDIELIMQVFIESAETLPKDFSYAFNLPYYGS